MWAPGGGAAVGRQHPPHHLSSIFPVQKSWWSTHEQLLFVEPPTYAPRVEAAVVARQRKRARQHGSQPPRRGADVPQARQHDCVVLKGPSGRIPMRRAHSEEAQSQVWVRPFTRGGWPLHHWRQLQALYTHCRPGGGKQTG